MASGRAAEWPLSLLTVSVCGVNERQAWSGGRRENHPPPSPVSSSLTHTLSFPGPPPARTSLPLPPEDASSALNTEPPASSDSKVNRAIPQLAALPRKCSLRPVEGWGVRARGEKRPFGLL